MSVVPLGGDNDCKLDCLVYEQEHEFDKNPIKGRFFLAGSSFKQQWRRNNLLFKLVVRMISRARLRNLVGGLRDLLAFHWHLVCV